MCEWFREISQLTNSLITIVHSKHSLNTSLWRHRNPETFLCPRRARPAFAVALQPCGLAPGPGLHSGPLPIQLHLKGSKIVHQSLVAHVTPFSIHPYIRVREHRTELWTGGGLGNSQCAWALVVFVLRKLKTTYCWMFVVKYVSSDEKVAWILHLVACARFMNVWIS